MRQIILLIITSFENLLGKWIQIRFVPKKDHYGRPKCYVNTPPRIAIVMQGPIIRKDSFTLETLRMYRELYPQVPIILSTWVGLTSDEERRVHSLEVKLVQSQRPIEAGQQNLGFQVKSTKAGIKSATDAEYVLKTRTDQRVLTVGNWITKIFIEYQRASSLGTKFICTNLNMYENRRCIMSDMFIFGSKIDVLNYFSPNRINLDYNLSSTLKTKYGMDGPEALLMHCYRDRFMSDPVSGTCTQDMYRIVDYREIDLFWLKYNRFIEKPYRLVDGKNTNIIKFDDKIDKVL